MSTKQRTRQALPPFTPPAGMTPPRDSQLPAQGITVAMFTAARGDCDCRTCKILRKMMDQLADSFLEEEDDAGSDDPVRG